MLGGEERQNNLKKTGEKGKGEMGKMHGRCVQRPERCQRKVGR